MSISNRHILASLAAAGLVLAGVPASAQAPYPGGSGPGGNGPGYDGRYHDPGAVYDFARVVDVQPLTTRVRVSTPQRECWDETRTEPGGYAPGSHGPQVAGHTLLGAAVGAVLGHQIGSGRGRDAATIGGAIVGAGIGHQQGMRRYGATLPARQYTVQRCETRYRDEWHERIEAYRVTYEYQGRRQVTELPYSPGDRIRVRVDVTPAEQ